MHERTHTTIRQIAQQKRRAALAGTKPVATKEHWRPKTRGDCVGLPRPCPYYGCRYHLGLDVTHAGSVRMPFGEALHAMTETCALDVADRGPHNLDKLGIILSYNKERVRQVIVEALAVLKNTLIFDEQSAQARHEGARCFVADDAVDPHPEESLAEED